MFFGSGLPTIALVVALLLLWWAGFKVPWRFALWLVLVVTLLDCAFSGEVIVSPAERVIMWVWSGSIVFLPVWWLWRLLTRRPRSR
jgi:hypothetical protein